MQQRLLRKLDKETEECVCVCVCEFLYALAAFVYFLFRSVCVCVCVTPGSTSYHGLIMEERLGSFITEPGCSGASGAGGRAQRAPATLKRWLNWKEGREILLVFMDACAGGPGKVKWAGHKRAEEKNCLPSMPQGFPYSLYRWEAT